MLANIVDLRYHMNEVLRALDRNESVTILYRGKKKATIVPIAQKKIASVREQEFFGMSRDSKRSVDEVMAELRGGRYDDL